MKILAIIAARGGSRSVKNKNIRELSGKPLIVYTIEQIKRWGKYDKLIVTTDSKEIADIAIKHGVEVPFMRPAELASNTTGKMDVLRHALLEAEKTYNMEFDALLDLDVTAPIRTIEDIENSLNLFKEKKPDSVVSVVKSRKNPYFNMLERQDDGSVKLCKQSPKVIKRRQDVPPVYDMNASIFVSKREFLLDANNKMFYSKKTYAYEMAEISGIDIDSEIDFKFIEFLIKEGIVRL